MSIAKNIKDLITAIESDCKNSILPPEDGLAAIGQPVVSFTLVRGTRDYLEKIVHQINRSYSNGAYDACAVMIRRLIETLIIEVFEKYNIADRIKDGNGDFYFLSGLIPAILNERTWNLGRQSKKALPKFKEIGDKSAHSRRYIALRSDIDEIKPYLRDVIQEFVSIAGLK
jgi:hypothetical protein